MNNRTDSSIDSLKNSVKELVHDGQEKVNAVKDRVIEVKDRGNVMLDRFVDVIKANPLKSVGIAFGVGYLGMRLFRR
jgi:ElaB/YqjD/DUF883 family membrane-anchored ribosome-binding protein